MKKATQHTLAGLFGLGALLVALGYLLGEFSLHGTRVPGIICLVIALIAAGLIGWQLHQVVPDPTATPPVTRRPNSAQRNGLVFGSVTMLLGLYLTLRSGVGMYDDSSAMGKIGFGLMGLGVVVAIAADRLGFTKSKKKSS